MCIHIYGVCGCILMAGGTRKVSRGNIWEFSGCCELRAGLPDYGLSACNDVGCRGIGCA